MIFIIIVSYRITR